MSDNKKPTHKVFVVEEREGEGKDEDAFWTRVGSAWPHKDGKGYNIVLSALPLKRPPRTCANSPTTTTRPTKENRYGASTSRNDNGRNRDQTSQPLLRGCFCQRVDNCCLHEIRWYCEGVCEVVDTGSQ